MDHRSPRTSELLSAIVTAHSAERIGVGEVVHALRNRAFGLSLLLLGLPNCLPMPPGIPVICGVLLCFVGAQMMVGRDELWLPRWLANKTISRRLLDKIISGALKWVRRFESYSRPRLIYFSSPSARFVLGGMVLVLGLLLLLPIPIFGNLPPGIAVCILGLGLVERDGAFIFAGIVATLISLGVMGLLSWMLFQGALAYI
ncbi:exopolysaccharide biosynthesis protein [Ancylobacter mangrovi]|uniref:Exopolysaccharide biosynthesis protein n=1 Tax=Ancylobacter mangrovi TaxID=2972472 RepID=A0A9X2PIQ6_9HYPH|nr:exopolysaccharide biosynthesis protein [Ancylobacter mangrovi]MCS0495992.1 exopolysaccharide biosynthesis protein [Ancylobacter mangrovi]MCS0504590.1 exopolysaccharide biosynthesis protein [Ancylobacter mangrovi]